MNSSINGAKTQTVNNKYIGSKLIVSKAFEIFSGIGISFVMWLKEPQKKF